MASDVGSDTGHHRISQLATLINGFPFDSADFSSDAEVPLVRIRDLGTSEFETFVSHETVPSAVFVRDGDVVIGMDGDFNSVLWGRGKAALNQRVCLLRARPGVDPRYLAYAIPPHLQVINDLTWSTTVKHLSAGSVRAIRVPAHSVARQRAIADYLDRETAQIDAFIAKNEELITLLTERRAAIVSRRVSQGLNPDAPTAMAGVGGLGLVPAHWKVERFARVAKIRGGLLDPSDSRFESWALIAPNHIRSATGELMDLVPASEQSAESGKYPIKKGDVVYSKIRPALAKAVIAPENCLCSADMYGITSRSSDLLDNRYLRWQLLSKWFTEWATERSMRVAMPKVNQDTLSSAPIIVPPFEEQREIVERIGSETEAVDAAISVARRSVDLARERRAALISAAVTGKIDVGVAV